MKNNNSTTVIYTISYPNFKFHVKKCKLLKNSFISKSIHPLREVEILKENLLQQGLLKDIGYVYSLKKDLSIGALMAYNLYSGVHKKSFDNPNPIVISETADKDIAHEFDFENIFSTDSILARAFEKNARKLEHIYSYNIRKEFLIGNNPNKFSETEQLIYDILQEEKILSPNARHGNSNQKECDIVDENQNIQIEIVTAFKLPMKDKTRNKHDVFSIMELVDTNMIRVSDGIFKKFYNKDYTNTFQKQLAIFSFGDLKTTQTLLKRLKEMIDDNPHLKNDFSTIYLVTYDFILDVIHVFNGKSINSYPNNKINYLNKIEISFDSLNDDEEYLITTKNIFNQKEAITILNGKEFKKFSKDFEIIH